MNSSPRCFNSHAQTVYRKLKAFILGHPANVSICLLSFHYDYDALTGSIPSQATVGSSHAVMTHLSFLLFSFTLIPYTYLALDSKKERQLYLDPSETRSAPFWPRSPEENVRTGVTRIKSLVWRNAAHAIHLQAVTLFTMDGTKCKGAEFKV